MTNLVTVRLSTNTFRAPVYSGAFFIDLIVICPQLTAMIPLIKRTFIVALSLQLYALSLTPYPFSLIFGHAITRESEGTGNLVDGISAEILRRSEAGTI
jgi:hypothetical protein